MDTKALPDLVSDPHDRIERGQRVLEDHSDLVPSEFTHLFLVQFHQALPLKKDTAPCEPAWKRNQTHKTQARDGLSAAALSDDAQDLTSLQVKGDPINGMDGSSPDEKSNFHVFDADHFPKTVSKVKFVIG